jgi:hypothetical protein
MRRPIAHDSGIYRIHKRSQQRTPERQLRQPNDGPNKALEWDTPTKNKARGQLEAGKSYRDVQKTYRGPGRTQHRWRTEISATNQARRARRDARKKGPPYCIGEAKLKRMIEHVEQGNYLNKYHGVELME